MTFDVAPTPVETVEGVVWPAWGFDEGLDRLARYVSTVALPAELADAGELAQDDVARDRYERLRGEKLRYAYEPYVPPRSNRQQIRDPRLLLRAGVGTCLDLATAYAAMCLEAHAAPLLAVGDGHAWVLLHLDALEALRNQRPMTLPGTEPHDRPGVLRVADLPALREAIEKDASVVAVDAVRVTRGSSFVDAARHGTALLRSTTRLVDVAWLHGHGVAPLRAPTRAPGIRPYAPGGRSAVTRYRGRGLPTELLARPGTIVLHGESGTGKTTIARALAVEQRLGAGWVLNASSRETLVDALAQAELAQRDIGVDELSDQLREGYAYAALDRLRTTDDEWVVVLDNADGSPRALRGLLPRPRGGQRLIVTTTNGRDWAAAPGVDHRVPLAPLSEEAILEELDGDAVLAAATGGLPLVLEAYRAFLSSEEHGATALHTAAQQRSGPAALWAALADVGAFDGRLSLCAVAALLPPDRVPATLAERLGDADDGAVGELARRGLLLDSGEAARLHRLFGAAVREALDADAGELLDGAAVRIATDAEALVLLDRHGDPVTIRSLDRRLGGIDDRTHHPDPTLGRALHGLAAVLELKGDTAGSAALYERAERHLQADTTEERRLLAECLHGRARLVNQRSTRDEPLLRAAVEWTQDAQRLQQGAGNPDGVGKSRALEGLLLQKTVNFAGTKADKLKILLDAKEILEEAHGLREDKLPVGHPELLRSEFNLAGNRVELAHLEREHARAHLGRAAEVYRNVDAGRRALYDLERHPHIAACRNGLGIVQYYVSLYVATTAEERTAALRAATGYVEDALAQRQAFDGDDDLADTQKSLALLGKILVARTALPLRAASTLHVRPPGDRRPPRPYFEEIGDELRDVLVFDDVPPLALGADPVAHAQAWFQAPVLAALCARLQIPLATGGSLLERFDRLVDDTAAWAAPDRLLSLAQYDEMAVVAAARALGLEAVATPAVAFDALVVPGGAARDCLARALAVAAELAAGRLAAPVVVGVAGARALSGPELGLLERLNRPAVATEADVLDVALRGLADLAPVLVTEPATDADDLVAAVAGALEQAAMAPAHRICVVTSMDERAAAVARAIAHAPQDVLVDGLGIDSGKIDYRLAFRPSATALLGRLHDMIAAYRDLVRSRA